MRDRRQGYRIWHGATVGGARPPIARCGIDEVLSSTKPSLHQHEDGAMGTLSGSNLVLSPGCDPCGRYFAVSRASEGL
jgi:hypothetical protein